GPAHGWFSCRRSAHRLRRWPPEGARAPPRALCRCAATSRAHRAKTGRTNPQPSLCSMWTRLCSLPAPVGDFHRDLLLRQQRRDVVQCLLCAVLVIAVFGDQPLLYGGDFLLGVVIGACA